MIVMSHSVSVYLFYSTTSAYPKEKRPAAEFAFKVCKPTSISSNNFYRSYSVTVDRVTTESLIRIDLA